MWGMDAGFSSGLKANSRLEGKERMLFFSLVFKVGKRDLKERKESV